MAAALSASCACRSSFCKGRELGDRVARDKFEQSIYELRLSDRARAQRAIRVEADARPIYDRGDRFAEPGQLGVDPIAGRR
jgi:hypothetical protein